MFLASALLIMAPAAAAGSPAPAPAPKVICRSETNLGSRIPVRVCRTETEWEALARQTQKDLEDSRNDRQLPGN